MRASLSPVTPMANMTASASWVVTAPCLSVATTPVTRPAASLCIPVTNVEPVMVAPRLLSLATRGSKMRSLTLPLHQQTSKSAWCAKAARAQRLPVAPHYLVPHNGWTLSTIRLPASSRGGNHHRNTEWRSQQPPTSLLVQQRAPLQAQHPVRDVQDKPASVWTSSAVDMQGSPSRVGRRNSLYIRSLTLNLNAARQS